MPLNLTGSSPTYNSTGLFGASLNGGTASIANPFPTNGTLTYAGRYKISSAQHGGALRVATGAASLLWVGADASGNATARFGGTGEIALSSTVNVADGSWHEWRIAANNATIYFFVDGVLVNAQSGTAASTGASYANPLEFRTFASGAFTWPGELDDIAIYTTCTNTATYTPAGSAISNGAAGLLAVWHFDNNLNDSASSGATTITLTGPTSGTTGAPSTNFTVGADAAITGTVIVTPSDGGAGGSFSPTTVSISSGSPTATFTYTPASNGAKTISVTNNGGLANPASITYTASSTAATAVTMSGPASGTVGATSTNFTIGANGLISGTVVVTPSDGGAGGTFSPATVSISSGTPTATFTYTASTAGVKTISVTNNGGLTNPSSITYTAAAAGFTANILFSPENWNVQPSFARSINAGAYFKTLFTGTTCTLNFDVSGISSPVSQISYQVDGTGAWITTTVAATVVITIPSSTSDYADKGGHLLHVIFKSSSEGLNRWGTASQTAIILTSITLDAGKTLTKPTARPLNGLAFGDSIREGVRTLNSTATNDTDRNDARQTTTLQLCDLLGAEIGNVGFGRQGFTVTGNPDVPIFGSTWNFLYNGVARPFTTPLDFIIINMGTNDASANTVSAATGVLNGLIAATTAKILVERPFRDTQQAANLQAAIAACTTPSRCAYVDTAGWFNTANSSDALHPYGNENITHIAPLEAAAVRSALTGSTPTTARTVTVSNLKTDATTLATGLTGVKVSFRDAAGPDIAGPMAYQSSAQTITAGVLTFTANTTLASGGTGWVDIKAPGLHYCGQAVVS